MEVQEVARVKKLGMAKKFGRSRSWKGQEVEKVKKFGSSRSWKVQEVGKVK
ncbi:hypothetical protein [Anaerocolumna jejuensis]|uniref:hypothetical protein n=1 Tax=Anaerocolumna jejuensis TaxID=259063 RepID=UPI00147FC6F3|nr:hypothetical protein [Anaerocolumna jejuensis]